MTPQTNTTTFKPRQCNLQIKVTPIEKDIYYEIGEPVDDASEPIGLYGISQAGLKALRDAIEEALKLGFDLNQLNKEQS